MSRRPVRSLPERVERALSRIPELPKGKVVRVYVENDQRLVEICYVPKAGQPGDPN